MSALTTNKSILDWIDEKVKLVNPAQIVWIDGSEEQLEALRKEACESGEMIKLNEDLLPGFTTLPVIHTRAEQCTLSLIQWVP